MVAQSVTSPGNGLVPSFNNVKNVNLTGNSSIVDGEPDVFFIRTATLNLRFTIDANGNPVMQNSNGIKIVHSLYKNTANASNTGFIVTDDIGNQYYFGTTAASRESITTKFFGQSFTFNSTWYLDKIITYNAKDVIALTYIQGQNDTVYYYGINKRFNYLYGGTVSPPVTDPIGSSGTPFGYVSVSQIIYNQPKYISQIISKLGEADFSYTYNSTSYINSSNPPELTSISIKQLDPISNSNNTIIKTFGLTFSEVETGLSGYTQPFPYNDIWSLYYRRLLTGVTLSGSTSGTSSPITLFTLKYNQDYAFAERESFSNWDYWGYANRTTYNFFDDSYFTTPTTSRLPTVYTSPATGLQIPTGSLMSLIEVDNVMGEKATINYEMNSYFDGTANQIAGGSRVYNITHKLPTGEQQYTNYIYNDQNNHSTGVLYNDFYKKVTMTFDQYGTGCCNLPTLCLSQSSYPVSDDHGISIGYSAVKVQSQTGGYEIDTYSNFNDNPDQISEPAIFLTPTGNATWGHANVGSIISSFSYKRGLPTSSIIYNSGGVKISEVDNIYSSLDSGPVKTEYGVQDNTWWLDITKSYGNTPVLVEVNVYNSNIENWRMTQSIKKEYDQNNATNFVQTTTNYTYCPNKRSIQAITVTDSKGLTYTKRLYHADDTGIPKVTLAEQTAITAMVNANRSNVLVDEVDTKNNVTKEVHNSFGVSSINNNNGFADVYAMTSTAYNTNNVTAVTTQATQGLYNYSYSSSNLASFNSLNGKSTSFQYGYNDCYPVAKVLNASSSYTLQPGLSSFGSTFTNSASYSIVSTVSGTIGLSFFLQGYPGANGQLTISYSVIGPSNASGTMCVGIAGSCSSSATTNIPNMPAGSYTVHFTISSNTGIFPSLNFVGTYPSLQSVFTNEFYYEGFEQGAWGGNVFYGSSAHTGNAYYATGSSYSLPFILPNTRNYILQYYTLVSGVWLFNEMPYTGPTTIAGIIDDVRVFPSDALMTTYTYSPLIGKTSEIDPSGRTTTYQYDGLGRLNTVRDNDGNILKKYCYNYASQALSCPANSSLTYTLNGSHVSWTVTLTNISTNAVYSYTLIPEPISLTGYPLGQIPVGNYNMVMSPGDGTFHMASFGNYLMSGTGSSSFTLNNIPISVNSNFIIQN